MSTTTTCPTVEAGIRRRDRKIGRMRSKPSVRTIAALAIAHAARTDLTVSANDIRDEACALCPDIDVSKDMGAAFRTLKMCGVAEIIGFGGHSTSDCAQGNYVRRWRVDAAAATVFLDRLAAETG